LKIKLKKCSGIKSDGSGYTDCSTLFIGSVCPNCGSKEPICIAELGVKELKKALDKMEAKETA